VSTDTSHPTHGQAMGQPGQPSVGRPNPGPTLYIPPPPGYHAPGSSAPVDGVAAGAAGFDPIASSVRNQVVDRLLRMSVRHAAHAWRHRRDRPIAPNAIAFLYADPVPIADGQQVQYFKVVAATRMVNDDPTVRDLPRLLHRLAALARERYLPTPGGFDPATHMTNHHDQASGSAQYIGLAISTLDTPAGSWDEIQSTATGTEDLPGRGYALLVDHSAILIDRAANREAYGTISIHSTGDLNVAWGMAGRMWIRHPDVSSMPAPPDAWERMYELHALTLNQPQRPAL